MAFFRTILPVFGILFLGLFQPASGQFTEQVGSLGDLKKLEIRGSTTFTSEAIKEPLWRSLDVQMAAHSKSILREYLVTLEDKVCEGYRYAGFWDVQVTSEVDHKAGTPVLIVTEGPRLTAGEVRIEGANSIPVADLVRRLTSRRPKDSQGTKPQDPGVKVREKVGKALGGFAKTEDTNPPIWELGKPARLDRETKKTRGTDIKDALADLGFMSARFFDDVVRNPDGKTVSLVVKIHDEGVQTVLDQIEISGNEKNSREEIIEYLGLKPGMPLNREMCGRLKERLWMSGRFVKCDVSLIPVFGRKEKQGIAIDLTEYSNGPRLSERLSPAEEALAKCRDSLTDASQWPGDLVCRVPSQGFEVVLSPKRGSLVMFYDRFDQGKPLRLHHALATNTSEVGFYNVATGKKYAFSSNGKQVQLNLTMKYTPDPKALENDMPFRVMFGAGFNTDDKKGKTPFRLTLTMDPVMFIALAHEHKPTYSIADNILTLKTTSDLWRVDVKSGQLLEWSLYGKEDGETMESGKLIVAFEKGTFDRRFEELSKGVAEHVNAFDPKQPFGSAGKFLVEDDAYWIKQLQKLYGSDVTKKIDPEAARIFNKLLGGGLLMPFDTIDWNAWNDDETGFKLREDNGFAKLGFTGIAAQLTLTASDYVFPRDSWPWTLTRESAMSIVGKGRHTQEEMYDLFSSTESGPVCCLVAGTLNLWTDPAMARKFAAKGLKKLDVKDFRKDYGFLLRPDHPIAKHTDEVLAALSVLDDDDIAYLVRSSKPKDAKYVAEGFRILRKQKGRPAVELLPEVLDTVWQNGLRDRVQTALENLENGFAPWQQNELAEKPSPIKK